MTACVKNHSKRVALAISASLVGALALGAAAPAVAEAAGIEALTATSTDAVKYGKITAVQDDEGNDYTELDNIEFTVDGFAHYITPTMFQAQYEDEASPVEDDANLKVVYYKQITGTPSGANQAYLPDGVTAVEWVKDPETITAAGTYYAAVRFADGGSASNCAFVEFKLVDRKLEDAQVTDADGNQLVYTGVPFTYAGTGNSGYYIHLGDKNLGAGTDFDLGPVFQNGEPVAEGSLIDAGDYVQRIYEHGTSKFIDIEFTIAPLDLTNAVLWFDNDTTEAGSTVNALVNTAMPQYIKYIDASTQLTSGSDEGLSTLNGDTVKLEFVSASNGSKAPSTAKGAYTYKVTAYKGNDPEKASTNIIGEREVVFTRYDKAADFEYDGDPFPSSQIKRFNEDYITVRGGGKKLDKTVTYAKKVNGKWVGVDKSVTQWPGEYMATVTAVDPSYTYGGSDTIEFKVNAIEVQEANAYVLYGDKVVEEGKTVEIYNGSNLMGNLSIKAYDEDGEQVPADAFDLEVTDAKGNVVTELVNAGTYTATIKEKDDSMYRLAAGADNDVKFKISPVTSTAQPIAKGDNAELRFAGVLTYGENLGKTYAWTGSAVVPSFEYDLIDHELGYDKAEEWITLPADSYKATFYSYDKKQDVKECVEPGHYRVTLKDNAKDGNHEIAGAYDFYISNDRVFLDVKNDEWYSEYVYTAAENAWMTGFDGTSMFMPDAQITRGQVAVVLWKMAGKPELTKDEGWWTENGGWETGFGDVDGNMYYSQAIAWAKACGLVTGYDGTDSFLPDAPVSRQELCTMLARYAAACGEDVSGASSDLSGYVDASQVAAFAQDAVDYLVSEGVFGQDTDALRPADAISRAEVAAMVVRLDGSFDFDLMPSNPDNPNVRPEN